MAQDTSAFIPEQLFVTLKEERNGAEYPLGFASPYGKDSAFKKRMYTQLNWAYYGASRYNATFDYRRYGYVATEEIPLHHVVNFETGEVEFFRWVDDLLSRTVEAEVWNSQEGRLEFQNFIAKKLEKIENHPFAPRTLENKPLEGFKFTEEIRRTYWGGGNVVWRVLDPRGFELEISSSNLARIMDCAVIDNGVIVGECIWGRLGAQNLLLPVSSDIYTSASAKTKKVEASKKMSLKDVKLGDAVELVNQIDQYEYLGGFKVLYSEQYISYARDSRPNYNYQVPSNIVDRYVLRNLTTDKYELFSSPKIARVVESAKKVLNKVDIAAQLNADIFKNHFESEENLLAFSATAIKGHVTLSFDHAVNPQTISSMEDIPSFNPTNYRTRRHTYFIRTAQILSKVEKFRIICTRYSRYNENKVLSKFTLADVSLSGEGLLYNLKSAGYNQYPTIITEARNEPIPASELYQLFITFNGITLPVRHVCDEF